jgi:predicted DNA-binding ribbon-helix-helix protein
MPLIQASVIWGTAIRLKMENAVVNEIYGKHDGGLRFSSQIRVHVLSKRNLQQAEITRSLAPGDRMT